jgi:hypothetical protein
MKLRSGARALQGERPDLSSKEFMLLVRCSFAVSSLVQEVIFHMAVPDRSGDIRQYGRSANRSGDSPIALIFLRVCPRRSLLRPPCSLAWSTRIPAPTPGQHGRERIHVSCRRLHARVRVEGPGCALSPNSIPRRIIVARTTLTEEVQVLRFFETGPIDKVEAVFNIICEKMRERLKGRQPTEASMARAGGSGKKRIPRQSAEASIQDGRADGQPG